jgi:large subunit ribosomal protein L6
MSRVGKQIIAIPANTEVSISADAVMVKGPKGELRRTLNPLVTVAVNGKEVTVTPMGTSKQVRSLWGTYASHIENMVEGVTKGFVRKLYVEVIGYRAEVSGTTLTLALGFSHPVKMTIPKGLAVTSEKGLVTISGFDKELVSLFAANVRAQKKPEPYKGKGIRYEGEVVKRKQGKKAAA